MLMVRDSPRAPRVVLVNAETADAAPGAGGAADNVRDRGTPGCEPAGLAAGAGAGAGGAGAGVAIVPTAVAFVLAVALGLYVPASKAFFVWAVSGLVPLVLADETVECAVLVEEGHAPLEAVPGAPPVARRGERHRDRIVRVRDGGARSRLVTGRVVFGKVQSLGVQVDVLGLGVLKQRLVFAVGVGQTVDKTIAWKASVQ